MKASEAFAAFTDLQDATAATDEQLKGMLAFGCKAGIAANFEDVMTEQLIRLFRHITGVQWIRGWEQGARPDAQHATVWLYGAKPIGSGEVEYQEVFNSQTNALETDLCEVVYQTFEYQFQLDVFGDSGVPSRNQELADTTGPRLSAADVLTRLITAFGHPRFRAALAESCLFLGYPPFGIVRNYAKPLIQNTNESRAGVDFFIRARPISSLRSPTFSNVDWGFLCPPDSELFPDPPPPVAC
jgi:hypothetical protein